MRRGASRPDTPHRADAAARPCAPRHRRTELALFLRRWLAHPLRIGAIAPSAPALARAMAEAARTELTNGNLVVELGPGTGSVTRAPRRGGRPRGASCPRGAGSAPPCLARRAISEGERAPLRCPATGRDPPPPGRPAGFPPWSPRCPSTACRGASATRSSGPRSACSPTTAPSCSTRTASPLPCPARHSVSPGGGSSSPPPTSPRHGLALLARPHRLNDRRPAPVRGC